MSFRRFNNSGLFAGNRALWLPPEAWIILVVGLSLRFHGFSVAPIINPDGALYIQQARALWYGLKDQVLACYSYLPIYPIFIYLFHFVVRDWIVAAKGVCLFFGTLTMVPLYWIALQFMGRWGAAFCMLAVAINPTYVAGSSSVLRGAVYWFFASLGMLMFIVSLKGKRPVWMVLSSASFLLAAWSRIEAVVYIGGSILFLLVRRDLRWRNLFYFLIPIALATILGMVVLAAMGQTQIALMGHERILSKAKGAIVSYNMVRDQLKELIIHWSHIPGGYPMMHFFMSTRNLIWLIALATVVIQIKRGFFWPVFIFFILGWPLTRKKLREHMELSYLLLLGGLGFIALYVQVLGGWAMESRFIALVLIPTLVFVGFGAEYLLERLGTKVAKTNWTVIILLSLLLLLPGLYKQRKAGIDRHVLLRQVGEFIAGREKGIREVTVAGSLRRLQLIHFYANLPFNGAPCFESNFWLRPHDVKGLSDAIDKGLNYFVWDNRNWTWEEIDKVEEQNNIDLRELRSWSMPDYGTVKLFEVVKAKGA